VLMNTNPFVGKEPITENFKNMLNGLRKKINDTLPRPSELSHIDRAIIRRTLTVPAVPDYKVCEYRYKVCDSTFHNPCSTGQGYTTACSVLELAKLFGLGTEYAENVQYVFEDSVLNKYWTVSTPSSLFCNMNDDELSMWVIASSTPIGLSDFCYYLKLEITKLRNFVVQEKEEFSEITINSKRYKLVPVE
jgi:hypothetical protein